MSTIVVVAVLTAAAVAFCGIISFVGLVVPAPDPDGRRARATGCWCRPAPSAAPCSWCCADLWARTAGRVRRPADRHAHRAGRRPVLLLAAPPRPSYGRGLGMTAPSAPAALSVSYDGHPILTDVDLDIRGGELVVLVGPNGAGKTTLLGVLSGDVDPSGGRVTLDDKPLASYAARELARERAVPAAEAGAGLRLPGPRGGPDGPLAVAPHRARGRRRPRGRRVDGARRRHRRSADRLYPTLSGGEQARTSFARLLAQETPVLLLDEPTAALDIRHQESLLAVARAARRRPARPSSSCCTTCRSPRRTPTASACSPHGRVRADGPPGRGADRPSC